MSSAYVEILKKQVLMLVRDGSSGLDDLSSECEGKQAKIKASFFPFPLSGHQKVPLTFRVNLLTSDNLGVKKTLDRSAQQLCFS